jgi:mannose/fructose/N-acetylgalactosamine-specific phosphotransferase system component IID
MVGMNAVIIYGGQITTEVIPSLKSIFPMIINLPPIFSALIISYFLSKYGRKQILMIGILCIGIINLFLGVGFFLKDSCPNASISLILIS